MKFLRNATRTGKLFVAWKGKLMIWLHSWFHSIIHRSKWFSMFDMPSDAVGQWFNVHVLIFLRRLHTLRVDAKSTSAFIVRVAIYTVEHKNVSDWSIPSTSLNLLHDELLLQTIMKSSMMNRTVLFSRALLCILQTCKVYIGQHWALVHRFVNDEGELELWQQSFIHIFSYHVDWFWLKLLVGDHVWVDAICCVVWFDSLVVWSSHYSYVFFEIRYNKINFFSQRHVSRRRWSSPTATTWTTTPW